MLFQRAFENIKQIQTYEGGHLKTEIRWKRNISSRNLQIVTFASIFCLINKIYWAWDITVSSYVVWAIKLNSVKYYLSRENVKHKILCNGTKRLKNGMFQQKQKYINCFWTTWIS